MKRLRRSLAAALCLSAGLLTLFGRDATGQPNPPAGPADLDQLIRQLGDPAYPKREEASRRLTDLGESALPALRAAMKSPDPEIRRRAEAIVHTLTYLSPE